MKHQICAVFDVAANAFHKPFYAPAIAAAVRSFHDEVNREAEDNQMYKHPGDYELHLLGTFDEETGVVECEAGFRRRLVKADDVKDAKKTT